MYLFAIIKDSECKKYKLIKEEVKPGTEYSLKWVLKPLQGYQYNINNYCYDDNLGSSYTNCLPQVEKDDGLVNQRKMAYALWEKSTEICEKYDVVALSHRRGGWHNTHWEFGDSVSFDIRTNFGFGSASYFDIVYKYKKLTLASFSHFIKYKNSTYASIMRCTRSFPLRYSWWEGLMNDCISFYNALVTKDKSYVFTWINEQLSALCSGLEGFVESNSWTFESYKEYGVSYHTEINGDDFWILKADKIAQSLQFITNIKELPIEINGVEYINRIINACNSIHPRLNTKIESVKHELLQAEEELNCLKSYLIEIIKKEPSFYPHRKYGIKKHVYKMFDAVDKRLGININNSFTARRKSQKDYIKQANMKLYDARKIKKKVRNNQELMEQLKSSEKKLSENLKELKFR